MSSRGGSVPYMPEKGSGERKAAQRDKMASQKQKMLSKRRKKRSSGIARSTRLSSPYSASPRSPQGQAFRFSASGEVKAIRQPQFGSPSKPQQVSRPDMSQGSASRDNLSASVVSPAQTEVVRQMSALGISSTYDPEPTSKPESQTQSERSLRDIVLKPAPKGVKILCNVRRLKKGMMSGNSFEVFRVDKDGREHFLMQAQKRSMQRTSNYIISMENKKVLKKDSEKYLGKLRANMMGTRYWAYDNGENPTKLAQASRSNATLRPHARKELAVVRYEPNKLPPNRGPRKMVVAIPASGNEFQPDAKNQGSMHAPLEEVIKGERQDARLLIMKNKQPQWNEKMNAYVLNFHGRVTKASVKNFQLATDARPDEVILQFGRTGEQNFSMDFVYPMNALQAFAISLTSLDEKAAVV